MLEVIKRTPKTAEEIKVETLAELNEMGFVNLPKATSTDTHDEMHEQIDNDSDIADRVFDEVYDCYADVGVYKDNYDERLNSWVEDQADAMHGEQ